MTHCHCTMCRKFYGAAFSTFDEAKVENFRWIKATEQLKTYQAANGTQRKFCQQCGFGNYLDISISIPWLINSAWRAAKYGPKILYSSYIFLLTKRKTSLK